MISERKHKRKPAFQKFKPLVVRHFIDDDDWQIAENVPDMSTIYSPKRTD